jgi:hypothetical protein
VSSPARDHRSILNVPRLLDTFMDGLKVRTGKKTGSGNKQILLHLDAEMSQGWKTGSRVFKVEANVSLR